MPSSPPGPSLASRRNRARVARHSALRTPCLLAACIAALWVVMAASPTVAEKKNCNTCTCSLPKSEKYAPPEPLFQLTLRRTALQNH